MIHGQSNEWRSGEIAKACDLCGRTKHVISRWLLRTWRPMTRLVSYTSSSPKYSDAGLADANTAYSLGNWRACELILSLSQSAALTTLKAAEPRQCSSDGGHSG